MQYVCAGAQDKCDGNCLEGMRGLFIAGEHNES